MTVAVPESAVVPGVVVHAFDVRHLRVRAVAVPEAWGRAKTALLAPWLRWFGYTMLYGVTVAMVAPGLFVFTAMVPAAVSLRLEWLDGRAAYRRRLAVARAAEVRVAVVSGGRLQVGS